MSSAARAALRTVLDPKSVAVIGASENPNKIGGRPLFYLSRFGFKGKVYPINPNRNEAQGYKAFPIWPRCPKCRRSRSSRCRATRRSRRWRSALPRGVKVAMVMTSGFGETADPAAQEKQRLMAERGRAERHAHHRAQHAGARQLRHRGGPELLHHVPRDRSRETGR